MLDCTSAFSYLLILLNSCYRYSCCHLSRFNIARHTTYIRNNVGQKCDGNCGFLVLNEMIKKIYVENLKSWVPFGSYLLNRTANPAQFEWKWDRTKNYFSLLFFHILNHVQIVGFCPKQFGLVKNSFWTYRRTWQ